VRWVRAGLARSYCVVLRVHWHTMDHLSDGVERRQKQLICAGKGQFPTMCSFTAETIVYVWSGEEVKIKTMKDRLPSTNVSAIESIIHNVLDHTADALILVDLRGACDAAEGAGRYCEYTLNVRGGQAFVDCAGMYCEYPLTLTFKGG
jgi:hypothetical protein